MISERLEQKPLARQWAYTVVAVETGSLDGRGGVQTMIDRPHGLRNATRWAEGSVDGTAGCGTACPVVWEGDGREPVPYKSAQARHTHALTVAPPTAAVLRVI
jgi:hypothetical protein